MIFVEIYCFIVQLLLFLVNKQNFNNIRQMSPVFSETVRIEGAVQKINFRLFGQPKVGENTGKELEF
jgi:hypothetical protein